jgi:dipeptidyl aminopeptidase/acylaminoacyl peptidase
MAKKRTGSFGSWSSPITADTVVAETVLLGDPRVDRNRVYWTEGRPSEGGRTVVVVRHSDGSIRDVTPAPFDVRSRVHEYGGGAYQVDNGTVYFVNFSDQQIYCQTLDGAPARLTFNGTCRYADIQVDRLRKRLIAIREEHSAGSGEAINTLVAIDLSTGSELVLDEGFDFYSSPTLSPDGLGLAWLSWRHPNMPWISTYLTVAQFTAGGGLTGRKIVAGGNAESVFQPQWSPNNILYFISDRTDLWNIYRWTGADVEPVLPRNAEFGVPQWQFGLSTYAFRSADTIVYAFSVDGMWRLGRLDVRSLQASDYDGVFSSVSGVHATATMVVARCSTPAEASAITVIDTNTGTLSPIKYAISPDKYRQFQPYFSQPQPVQFPTDSGDTAYAFFYPPSNPDWELPGSERPPLLVKSHGGPTAATSSGLDLSVQYWTSRGFAVIDVNYRGSTGYGRKYREKLYGKWGVVDVADCISAARYLTTQRQVDGTKLAVRGGSAGGYTTLCGLTFHNEFSAGASYYGISDLVALATETHKFESHYTDWLIEPYKPGSALYHDRSPINFVQNLSAPVIFFHGEDDRVVPLDQAQRMYDALRKRAISTCLLVFEGEQHGFRQSTHIRRGLEAELMFYSMNLLRTPLNS